MKEITIGCDPEFWVVDKKKKEVISAHGMVEGTKYAPQPLKNGGIQVDGTALEFTINPAREEQEFIDNIDSVLQQTQELIGKDYEFKFHPDNVFDADYFNNEVPEEAKILGCEPDFNAYTGLENIKPNANTTLRTAAGHVHVGCSDTDNPRDFHHFTNCRIYAAAMDVLIGAPLSLLEPKNQRQKLYGEAGAFRPKHYGLEWRVASNHWLTDNSLKSFVFNQSKKVYDFLINKDNKLNNANIWVFKGLISDIAYKDYLKKDNLNYLWGEEMTEKLGF